MWCKGEDELGENGWRHRGKLGKMVERGKARKESRRKKRACSQAISQPIELPRPFSTAFGFSPSRTKTFGIGSSRVLYDSQCSNRLPQIRRTNPDPIARDFNMNCLLMATCPRGRTVRRYLELSFRRQRHLHDVAMSRNVWSIIEIRDVLARRKRRSVCRRKGLILPQRRLTCQSHRNPSSVAGIARDCRKY